VLPDTGSVGTVFAADKVLTIGLRYEAEDAVHRIQGVGGAGFVFTKRVDRLSVGELQAGDFEIEVGAMGYGFEVEGIVGMDFLMHVGAVLDLARVEMVDSQAERAVGNVVRKARTMPC
jgi:hypothetical protein